MNGEKESTYLDAAFKHHLSAHAAIQSLQEQLGYLEDLRKSARETSLLREEKELEKSTADLLSSTRQYLLESPNKPISSLLSSTVNNHEAISLKDTDNLSDFLSPIKRFGHIDCFESTALTPTSAAPSNLSSAAMSGLKFSLNSARITSKPTRGKDGSLNLTEILTRLAGGSSFGSTGNDSINNSDELTVVLEKIAKASQELQVELQNSKARELKLLDEIYRLRSHTNGCSPHLENQKKFSPSNAEVARKCRKLENAMLSLQEENLKLNKMLRERNSEAQDDEMKETKRCLVATQSENRLLQATIVRMKAQLAYYEERHNRQSTEISPNLIDSQHGPMIEAINERRLLLEEKIQQLESELVATRTGSSNNTELQARIDEMHEALVQKNNYINQCETDLRCARLENKELTDKFDILRDKDVYKRKEVFLLCDKFEQLKAKCLELEEEVLRLRKTREVGREKQTASDSSLKKFLLENEALHRRLVAEQLELSMSKSNSEKDHISLKERYEKLLSSISGVETNSDKNFSKFSEDNKRSASAFSCKCKFSASQVENGQLPSGKSQPVQSNISYRGHRPTSKRSDFKHYHLSRTTPEVRSYSVKNAHANGFSHSKHKNQPISSGLVSRAPEQPFQFVGDIPAQTTQLQSSVPRCSCRVLKNSNFTKAPTEVNDVITVAGDDEVLPSLLDGCAEICKENIPLEIEHESREFRDEYFRNMRGTLRSRSCDQLSRDVSYLGTAEKNCLRSSSEILSATPTLRRRYHTSPSTIVSNFCALATPTQRPHSGEFLSGMEDSRLLMNFDKNDRTAGPILPNDGSPNKMSSVAAKFPCKSFSKCEENTILPRDETLNKSYGVCDAASTPVPSIFSSNFKMDSSVPLEPGFSTESDSSLHLSDLPCDQATVVDKFRNFDDYKQPPPIAEGEVSDRCKPSVACKKERIKDRKITKKRNEKFSARHPMKKSKEVKKTLDRYAPKTVNAAAPISPKKKDNAVDQSSASTTRDHAGRIEFLRNIQINSGVRLPALLADASILDAVLLTDSELHGEVRLGLSDNQEAYADKLVTKYTRNAGKILNLH